MKKRMWQAAVLGLITLFFIAFGFGSIAECATNEDRIAQLEAETARLRVTIATKAEAKDVEALAKYQGEAARVLHDTAGILAGLRQEAATKGELSGVREQVAAVKASLDQTDQTLAHVADSTDERLRKLEKRVVGVRQVVARVGALEDRSGIDYAERLFRLSGFASGSAELTKAMEKELGKVVKLANSGWDVNVVAGFADPRPFKDDKDGKRNEELATARAKVVAEYLEKTLGGPSVKCEGRGATDKFGGLEMNRSVLIYLERSSVPPAPAPAAAPATLAPPAPPAAPPAPPAKAAPPVPPAAPPAGLPGPPPPLGSPVPQK